MLPAQLGDRPAVAADAATASRSSWSKRTVKGVDYVVFKGAAGSYTATLRDRHRARRTITGVTATRRRRGPRHGHVDDRRAVHARASSTAAPRRSATRSTATAPVTEHSIELTGLTPGHDLLASA